MTGDTSDEVREPVEFDTPRSSAEPSDSIIDGGVALKFNDGMSTKPKFVSSIGRPQSDILQKKTIRMLN